MACGLALNMLRLSVRVPSLPAPKTTDTPSFQAASIARLTGCSGSYAVKAPGPQLLLMALMLYSARCASAWSNAASTLTASTTSPVPYPTRCAPYATPRYLVGSAPAVPQPAAMPATCDP